MHIIYTGREEQISPKIRNKMENKLRKISKMLEQRGEREAHVILRQERFLYNLEITINAFDHALVCAGKDADLETAANTAMDKLEKQVVKMREKWRDTKRSVSKEEVVAATAPPPKPAKAASNGNRRPRRVEEEEEATSDVKVGKRIYHVTHSDGSKPMTIEEAILEIEPKGDYVVYRDAKTERLSVLMRRKDGHFDLIES